jgi:hypothetical protein
VIVLAVVTIGLLGIIGIWGEDLRRLFDDDREAGIPSEAPPAPPSGSASGPF